LIDWASFDNGDGRLSESNFKSFELSQCEKILHLLIPAQTKPFLLIAYLRFLTFKE